MLFVSKLVILVYAGLTVSGLDADWAEFVSMGENNVGAYDTGKFKNRDHTPIEAFISVEPHKYYSGQTLKVQNDGGLFADRNHDFNCLQSLFGISPTFLSTASQDNLKCGDEVACDPHGDKPCCSPFGFCGNTNEFCTCMSTVSDKGKELGPCRDFREEPDVIIKKKGYDSYYKSGKNPLPITVFWKFPATITIWSFYFAVPEAQLSSAPLVYSIGKIMFGKTFTFT